MFFLFYFFSKWELSSLDDPSLKIEVPKNEFIESMNLVMKIQFQS